MPTTRIDVMRHGEPEGGDVLRGRTDLPLTEKGWYQARSRASGCGNNDWDIILTSPLKRCAEFAEDYAGSSGIDLSEKPLWQEIDYGEWDGIETSRLWAEHKHEMELLWKDPMKFCAPGGESVSEFDQRIRRAWQETLDQHCGKKILIVCHGGVMRLLWQQLQKTHPSAMSRINIPYAAMSRWVIHHDENEGIRKDWVSLVSHHGDEL